MGNLRWSAGSTVIQHFITCWAFRALLAFVTGAIVGERGASLGVSPGAWTPHLEPQCCVCTVVAMIVGIRGCCEWPQEEGVGRSDM